MANGWSIGATLDISRRSNDKSVFILRSCAPATMRHLCLSPTGVDKLTLINADADDINAVRQALMHWPRAIQQELAVNGGHQWKLNGRPWVGSVAPVGGFGLTNTNTPGNENDTARHLITVIMSMLAGRGWQLVAAADVCSIYAGVVSGTNTSLTDTFNETVNSFSNANEMDVHSLFFAQIAAPQAGTSVGGGKEKVVDKVPIA